jgi:hypothetical protein
MVWIVSARLRGARPYDEREPPWMDSRRRKTPAGG